MVVCDPNQILPAPGTPANQRRASLIDRCLPIGPGGPITVAVLAGARALDPTAPWQPPLAPKFYSHQPKQRPLVSVAPHDVALPSSAALPSSTS
jgi:hypothetical protein